MNVSSLIERKVLSEAFQEMMAGWRLRSAVFLTYRFDPGFFEQEVLPVFFDIPMSHAPVARLLHLADVLRETGPVAVYYDRRALEPGGASARTDFQRIGVSHGTGYFHPKNAFLLLESNAPKSEWAGNVRPKRLIVASMSANLTRAGWWENVEVAHIETVEEGIFCGFRDDLLSLIALVRRESPRGTAHLALDEIHSFVRRCKQDLQRLYAGSLISRLFTGDQDLPDFLEEVAGNRLRNRCLEVISPYFDNTESVTPLRELISRFRPQQTRVFLPRGAAGEALCSEEFWKCIRATGALWAKLPPDVVRLSREKDRFVHAKVYRFFDPDDRRQTFFVGSVNLTNSGFGRGGNVETGFLVEVDSKRKSSWWLDVDERRPACFSTESEGDSLEVGPGTNLVLRFDWSTGIAQGFWDASTFSPVLLLRGSGVRLGEIGPLAPRAPTNLDDDGGSRLKEHLLSSSFVTVAVEGEADAIVLVDEDGAIDKPSILATLSADEILRYWSLLTDAQKQEFFESHAPELSDPELAMWMGDTDLRPSEAGMFGTFAHIFLSFKNLERTVRGALAERRHKEAVDRLFGQKFDSVLRLVRRIAEREEPNLVRDYIALLCAIQLLDVLKKGEPEFYALERSRFDLAVTACATLELLKLRFTFAGKDEREQFFIWLERWFLRRAIPGGPEQLA